MKHTSTRAVFDYWNKLRGNRAAPERADIDPGEIRHALSDTFMLAADFVDQLRFRLAGTRVCALFAREIKGEAFNELWPEMSREAIDELLAIVIDENVGVVAGLSGRTADGAATDLEMLLLPLAHTGQGRIRALGAPCRQRRDGHPHPRPAGRRRLDPVRHEVLDVRRPPGRLVLRLREDRTGGVARP